jgi:serine/threonine protein kinase/Tfp pilus assembly protein PilF
VNSLIKVCQKCGTEIPADAPEGGCPGCLLQTARDAAGGQVVFGRYTLIKVLGRGGMGIVWRARDEELERDVALKFLPDLMIQDRSLLDQLKRETKRCLELTHPHIVRIHDFVHDERSGCISMEYVDGETLSNLRAEKEHRVFEPSEINAWISQLCEALDYAHNRARVIHRDLKPANLMLNQRGDLKVTDFGIARSLVDSASRLAAEEGRSGTLVYMSPQQLNGELTTHSDDIYSLGATIYELLTSRPPFYSGNIDRQICERIAPSMTERRKEFNIEPCSVPQIWEKVVAACLAKDPSRRPQSVLDVAQSLQLPTGSARIAIAAGRSVNKKLLLIGGIAAASALVLSAVYFGQSKRDTASVLPVPAIPEKSIAVLPFENLSDQKQNAYFADGVQDEILTDLAKVGDLKVISRTSVRQYRDVGTRNVRDIAQQLGVAHILEGTVQRVGDRVKISAQLIDGRSDTHIWATTFDRSLTDVFAVQSEIALNIVSQLKAKLSSAEEAAIKQKPTNDLIAYDRFVRARSLIDSTGFSSQPEQGLLEAARLLEEAVARDPTFLRAYCELAWVHDTFYIFGVDHTPSRVAMADRAIEKAVAINPNAGEVHLAKASHLYCAYLDYDAARRELAIASRLLPNEPRCFELAGYMDRRTGEWEAAAKALSKALELDPRSIDLHIQLSQTYEHMRRFSEKTKVLDQAIAIAPDDIAVRVARAWVDLEWRADPKPLRTAIDRAIAKDPTVAAEVAQGWFYVAVCERNWKAARQAMAATSRDVCRTENVAFPPIWCEGFIERAQGNIAAARKAFSIARAECEKVVREQPNFGEALSVLGLTEAALGDKQKAIEHGERAVQLVPPSKDAINGPLLIEYLSLIYSWTGEKDRALAELKRATEIPSPTNYGDLRLHPFWDELRGDPRFEQIVASMAPK